MGEVSFGSSVQTKSYNCGGVIPCRSYDSLYSVCRYWFFSLTNGKLPKSLPAKSLPLTREVAPAKAGDGGRDFKVSPPVSAKGADSPLVRGGPDSGACPITPDLTIQIKDNIRFILLCCAKVNVIIKATYDKSHFQIKQARAKIIILSDRV